MRKKVLRWLALACVTTAALAISACGMLPNNNSSSVSDSSGNSVSKEETFSSEEATSSSEEATSSSEEENSSSENTHEHSFDDWTPYGVTDGVPCTQRLYSRICDDCGDIEWKRGEHSLAESGYCSVCGKNLTAGTEGLQYTLVGDEYSVTGYRGTDTEVIIPSAHAGKVVTSIGNYAFYNCSSLTRVEIPDSVTSIGNYAFYCCSSLTSVVIPDSVTSIGDSAFYGCSSLTSVVIGDSVTSIGGGAFYNTGYYNKAESWENDVLYIGKYLIEAKYTIQGKYIIKEGTLCIADSAFYNCSSLTSVEIPNSVTSIGNYAFYCCSSLTSVVIGDSVTSIGNYAFYCCSSLTSVVIGDSVTSIGYRAFDGCSSLTDVYYTGDIESWCKILGLEYLMRDSLSNKKLYLNNQLVTNLVIPDSVTSIGNYAFCDCDSLTSMTLGKSVKNIGSFAFANCSNLESVVIPEGVNDVCIEYGAFGGCESLKKVYYTGDIHSWKNISVTVNDSITLNGADLYIQNQLMGEIVIPSSLENAVIPEGTTEILPASFKNRSFLKNIEIPDSVTSIGYSAFYGCSSLESIVIPNGVTEIDSYTFYGCTNLKNVVIPDSVTSIGDSAFANCSSLENIVIPDSVKRIYGGAFKGCTALKNVIIPDSVERIGRWVFQGCSSLTSVVLSKSVKKIEEYTFDGCGKLTSVYYKGTAEELNKITVKGYNEELRLAKFYYYSETQPIVDDNYWHYVDGVVTVWA